MSQAQGEHMSIIPQRKYTSISNAVFRIPSDIESTANDAAKNCDEEKNSSRIVPHPAPLGAGLTSPAATLLTHTLPPNLPLLLSFCWVPCIGLVR